MRRRFGSRFCVALALVGGLAVWAQTDPGPRRGPILSGAPLPGATAQELIQFENGKRVFGEIESVADGLGPRFNFDSCGGCHVHPAPGGTSPAFNPQVPLATKAGAKNRIPGFITADGPIRVVRFRRAPDGAPDGGVHDLFVISGRSDAPPGCEIQQPDFSRLDNLAFRIPAPAFGLGLVEAIPDAVLRANLASNADRKRAAGIAGRLNTNGNDGTITRFGWKAQNKSLAIFSGEAYNVEMGVTNDLFPQEREEDPACQSAAAPEDHASLDNGTQSDVALLTMFMRYLAPPAPAPPDPSTTRGRALFDSTGCALCHTPTLRTGHSYSNSLNNRDVNLYSDLAIHRLGALLADGISQGAAQGQDFRTAPLWGLGDRIFLLHDGRTKDLLEAIRQHDSPGSEAHAVIMNFQALTPDQKQDILNFLRSL